MQTSAASHAKLLTVNRASVAVCVKSSDVAVGNDLGEGRIE